MLGIALFLFYILKKRRRKLNGLLDRLWMETRNESKSSWFSTDLLALASLQSLILYSHYSMDILLSSMRELSARQVIPLLLKLLRTIRWLQYSTTETLVVLKTTRG